MCAYLHTCTHFETPSSGVKEHKERLCIDTIVKTFKLVIVLKKTSQGCKWCVLARVRQCVCTSVYVCCLVLGADHWARLPDIRKRDL